MMELIQAAAIEFANGPYYVPFLVILGMVLNNLIVYKLMKHDHSKDMNALQRMNRSERKRATETINALRGIIWAFQDAVQEDEKPEETKCWFPEPKSNLVKGKLNITTGSGSNATSSTELNGLANNHCRGYV